MGNSSSIEILNVLDRVQQLLSEMKSSGGLSSIERDMVLVRLRNLYEEALRTEATPQPVPPLVAEKKIEPEPKPKPEPRPEPKITPVAKEPVVEKKPEPEPEPELVLELLPEPEPIPVAKPEPIIEQPKITPTPEPKVEEKKEEEHHPKEPAAHKEILAESFGKTKFLNDILSQYGNANDLSKKFQQQPISDIFTAIGINEKFIFVKELFGGNPEVYQKTLQQINQAANFNEAVEYLDQQFKWDFENQVVKKLLDLVHRRHHI